jgi:hypothetical protein
MPPRTDFLEKQRKQIASRLQELRPLHEEYLTLLSAQEALDSVKSPGRRNRSVTASGTTRARATRGRTTRAQGARGRKRGPGRPPGRPRGRPRAGGRRAGRTRADEALALITANPGITVPEIARKLGIRQNYLYRVMGELQRQRKVRRRQRAYHPA